MGSFIKLAIIVSTIIVAILLFYSLIPGDEVEEHRARLSVEETKALFNSERVAGISGSATDFHRVFNLDLNEGISSFQLGDEDLEVIRHALSPAQPAELEKIGCPVTKAEWAPENLCKHVDRPAGEYEVFLHRYELRQPAHKQQNVVLIHAATGRVFILTVPDRS